MSILCIIRPGVEEWGIVKLFVGDYIANSALFTLKKENDGRSHPLPRGRWKR